MNKLEKRVGELERKDAPPVRVFVLWGDEDRRRADEEATPDDIIIDVEWCDVWPPRSDIVLADDVEEGDE